MAIYVGIRKISEDEIEVIYAFGTETDERLTGRLRLDKTNGEIEELQPCQQDSQQRFFRRAARKLSLHYQRGEYPDSTCWAS